MDMNKNMLAGRSYSLEKMEDGVGRENHWPPILMVWSAADEPREKQMWDNENLGEPAVTEPLEEEEEESSKRRM